MAERLIVTLGTLAFHAVLADTVATGSPRSLRTLHRIPLRNVVAAVENKPDYAILAGLPLDVLSEEERTRVNVVRFLFYQAGSSGISIHRLWNEFHNALTTVIKRSGMPEPRCGDLRRWADESAPLPPDDPDADHPPPGPPLGTAP
ncbi:hypothetical protein [Streptomyces sp. NPDC003077]|uniref:hypothetical protein n=1 Tax=Streptomyces sp. NPDC003077 TaxID=3154443 RepID=UPI0033AF152F